MIFFRRDSGGFLDERDPGPIGKAWRRARLAIKDTPEGKLLAQAEALRRARALRGRLAAASAAAAICLAVCWALESGAAGSDFHASSPVLTGHAEALEAGLRSAPRSEEAARCADRVVRWLLAEASPGLLLEQEEQLKDAARLIGHARRSTPDSHRALSALMSHPSGAVRRAAELHGRAIGFTPLRARGEASDSERNGGTR